MKFCPNCEVKLKQDNSGLQCPKCDYVEGKEIKQTKKIIEKHESQLNVLSQNETVETLPTIKIDCEKCGNDEAVWWMLQTRSADEPTTQFYRCSKCRYTWRNYA